MQHAMPDADDGRALTSVAWQAVTWDGNRDALLDSTLTATPAQRLAWLEDAIEIAYRAGASSNRATRAPSLKPQAQSLARRGERRFL